MACSNGRSKHGTVALKSIFLHVTKACNLHCRYCYFSARDPYPGELTAGELLHLWPEMVELGPDKVVFTGGEPLLRFDLLELLGGLRAADGSHTIRRCLNTNGHLLTPRLARQLVGLADEVRVSLDAFPALNDAARGRGNFEAAVAAIDRFVEVGFDPVVLVTVTRTTLPDLPELVEMLARRGIQRIHLNRMRPIGRAATRPDWLVSHEELTKALGHAWLARFGLPVPLQHPEETVSTCGVGLFLNILPDGDVFPCHALMQREFRLGSVRYESLSRLCRRTGLLGELERLDLRTLASADSELAGLTRSRTCMGEVYERTRNRAIWREALSLPGFGIDPPPENGKQGGPGGQEEASAVPDVWQV